MQEVRSFGEDERFDVGQPGQQLLLTARGRLGSSAPQDGQDWLGDVARLFRSKRPPSHRRPYFITVLTCIQWNKRSGGPATEA